MLLKRVEKVQEIHQFKTAQPVPSPNFRFCFIKRAPHRSLFEVLCVEVTMWKENPQSHLTQFLFILIQKQTLRIVDVEDHCILKSFESKPHYIKIYLLHFNA